MFESSLLSRALRSRAVQKGITAAAPHQFFRWYLRERAGLLGLSRHTYVLSFDVDFRRDVDTLPEVLRILKRHSLRASFACIGRWIEEEPEIHREILKEGHEILNHTYSHPDNEELNPLERFGELTAERREEEIRRCHEACAEKLGYTPKGFRSPHFGREHTEDVYRTLQELGYAYSSSTIDVQQPDFGVPRQLPLGLWEIPVGCCASFPFTLFDSWNTRTSDHALFSDDVAVAREFERTLDILAETSSFLSHYFDPADIMRNRKLVYMAEALKSRGVQPVLYYDLLSRLEYAH